MTTNGMLLTDENIKYFNENMDNLIEGSPMLYDFEIENLPDDQIVIHLEANANLSVHACTKTAAGFSIRIKCLGVFGSADSENPFPPPKTSV